MESTRIPVAISVGCRDVAFQRQGGAFNVPLSALRVVSATSRVLTSLSIFSSNSCISWPSSERSRWLQISPVYGCVVSVLGSGRITTKVKLKNSDFGVILKRQLNNTAWP